MTKSYKEMNITELKAERERVNYLLKYTKNRFTKRQNTKYLGKIIKEIKEYERITKSEQL